MEVVYFVMKYSDITLRNITLICASFAPSFSICVAAVFCYIDEEKYKARHIDSCYKLTNLLISIIVYEQRD
jgi:hypothetical protein